MQLFRPAMRRGDARRWPTEICTARRVHSLVQADFAGSPCFTAAGRSPPANRRVESGTAGHVVEHAQVGKQIELLEDVADVVGAEPVALGTQRDDHFVPSSTTCPRAVAGRRRRASKVLLAAAARAVRRRSPALISSVSIARTSRSASRQRWRTKAARHDALACKSMRRPDAQVALNWARGVT
jgi:hypothetical protein